MEDCDKDEEDLSFYDEALAYYELEDSEAIEGGEYVASGFNSSFDLMSEAYCQNFSCLEMAGNVTGETWTQSGFDQAADAFLGDE